MPDVTGSLRNLTDSFSTILTMSRRSRRRHNIIGTVDIYEKVKPHPELARAAADIVAIIDLETSALLSVVRPTSRRKYPLSSSITALLLGFALGTGAWGAWTAINTWWGVVLFGWATIPGLLLTLVAVLMLVERESITPELGASLPEGPLPTKPR